ncbi:protein-disulfide reductase DsbD family protein [Salegentibacter mishustinae]|uniref:Disulfide bond formation protein DsbD n=1 Tax=Salegentibacter mishustinae TaxID=270918 RepID=A0A0Q9Z7X4_9FLAO|nr:thioredoxin family protein [Salegentibacter mishustinae]KRG29052.1 disulfide bond formation protein DsbD [Salegentibacter mishustinae]PNW21896.1 disulfide bond formation protein DsbD [Salegentibacter mishustinae]PZX65244.1 thiol:disulfide interchange protein DsbD [Salegentibacter mishustinae]GGW86379.1 thiol:disulfide interchange protein DsbD [Salegentibacter mishustinae]
MKYLASLLLFFIPFIQLQAQYFNDGSEDSQMDDPITWEASVEKENDSIFNLVFTATLEEGWHLYSQKEADIDIAPIATTFSYNNAEENFELIGETTEPDIEPIYDQVFEADITYFEDEAVFTQQIKVQPGSKPGIIAEIYFSVCDDEKCLPPETERFNISLQDNEITEGFTDLEISEKDKELTEALNINVSGMEKFEPEEKEGNNFLSIFLLGFVGGLIALLTPCVFPMIPLTVSFFTKGAKNRQKGLVNAILYGVFIFAIYLLLSLPFHLLDSVNPEILNNISTNVTLNIIFFVIFIIFAFSFFGYYEITLPSSWSNKMDDKASSVGGIVGIFFMALTLALVSFSCTGPILGSLLGGSLTSDGGAMQLSMGMGGFGLALALPFALFALFPNWLNSLPKSGGWLNTVKVTLGFIELGLAFKFLSNADLVEHWGLLKREIFLGIWILVGLGLMAYLFGQIRFPHDGPKQRISKARFGAGVITFFFVLYLIPGLTNTSAANLKLLSGFPPPLFYSIYEKGTEAPLGLEAYKDWDKGLEAAREQNKPIILDFTGWACVNCRKMEEQVWSEPEVFEMLNEEYILISLYVDDRKELPEEAQFNYMKPKGGIKPIKTIGDKWATFQTLNFKNNSQPFYVLLDNQVNLLNEPVGYTPKASEYLDWLKEGLTKFQETEK